MRRNRWLPLIAALFAPLFQMEAQSPSSSDKIVVPEGTDIKLKLLEALSSKTAKVGDPVALEVVQDVRVRGTVIIPKGAKAHGDITSVKRSGIMGKGGELALRPDYVRAGDFKISLRGAKNAEGESKLGKAIALTAISGVGVLKRGQQADIPEGTLLTAFVTNDTSVPISAIPPPEVSPPPRVATEPVSSVNAAAPRSDAEPSPPAAPLRGDAEPSPPAETAHAPAVVCDSFRQPRQVSRGFYEHVLPGVVFGNDNFEEVHLANKDKKDETVTLERYTAAGCLIETLDKVVPAKGKADLRLDLSQAKPGYGWVRVVTQGRAVEATTTHEVIVRNTLVSVPNKFFPRQPARRLLRVNHRWVVNLQNQPAFMAFFVNLSEYPVRVGACSASGPTYTCRSLNKTLAPMAEIAFRFNASNRFVIVESQPGYSVLTAVHYTDGEKQLFNSTAAISFGEIIDK